jgi:hypothetical protein
MENTRDGLMDLFIHPTKHRNPRALALSAQQVTLPKDEAFELTARLLRVVFPRECRRTSARSVRRAYYYARETGRRNLRSN